MNSWEAYNKQYINSGNMAAQTPINYIDKRKPITERLKGQRLGQALWNAIGQDTIEQRYKNTDQSWDEIISRRLFYISDEELRKLLNDYLREL